MSETFTKAEDAYFENRGGGDEPAATPEPAAPSEPAAEPEQDEAEPSLEGDAPRSRDAKVPLGALDKERARRRSLETELATLRGEMAGRFQQMETFLRPQQPAQQQAPQIPDFSTDPRGHIEARMAELERVAGEARQRSDQLTAEQQRQQAVQSVVSHANSDEARFAKVTPDYQEATSFLRAQREAELAAMGYAPDQIRPVIQQETLQLAAAAMQSGASFAENIYRVAKARGFVAGTPAGDADDSRLDTIARGQQLAAGVGSAGRAPAATLTRDKAANMSAEAFGRLSEAQQMRLLGGG